MERDGRTLDPDGGAAALMGYAQAGFDTFDMADHYGSAEVISGRFLERVASERSPAIGRPVVCTKWCPSPGAMTPDVVRAGVERSLTRLGVPRIDLLQFHWWSFEHPGYLDAMKALAALRQEGVIAHLGVTNFDTDHLRVLVKQGIPIVSNQVSFSVLDRRAAEEMSRFCRDEGIKLLAYGTLAGGLISERWLGQPEPGADDIADWSKMKYKRFVDSIGGWGVLQRILEALRGVAEKHGVSVPNVATRWVLEHPAVAAVIVGARLGEREHRTDNQRLFSFALDEQDRKAIEAALSIPEASGRRCADTAAPFGFATASWSAAPRQPTPKARWSAPAIRRGRRSTSSTR